MKMHFETKIRDTGSGGYKLFTVDYEPRANDDVIVRLWDIGDPNRGSTATMYIGREDLPDVIYMLQACTRREEETG